MPVGIIPKRQWIIERARYLRHIAMPAKPETAIRWIKDELGAALSALDRAVSQGVIRIEHDRLVIPKFRAIEEDEQNGAIDDALNGVTIRPILRKPVQPSVPRWRHRR